MSTLRDTHFTIVGAGRIGQTFAAVAPKHTLIEENSLNDLPAGPIVICTRNDDLVPVLMRFHKASFRSDLCANGMKVFKLQILRAQHRCCCILLSARLAPKL